jgi:carbon-monoxide dehydrogenase large subunit
MSDTRAIRLNVNGQERSATVETRLTLADLLREEFRLTGTHLGCEHGVCGACTVLVNGDAVRSCLMLAVQAHGATVQTVEGLAPDAGSLSPLQARFIEHHAVQCGFCTPGILMSLTAALAGSLRPTEEDVREALAGNLCRCTGYQGMVDAVLALLGGSGGQDVPPEGPRDGAQAYIGARVRRREDPRLVTGRSRFVDDLDVPDALHAAVLRSPHAHARIVAIDTGAARALAGVVAVVTARDVADIQKAWPIKVPHPRLRYFPRYALPLEKVRYVGEAVAVVVATSRYVAEDARDLIEVVYKPLPVVASAEAGLAPGAALVHEDAGDNIAAHVVQKTGDVERALAQADHTLKDTFTMIRGGGHSMEGRGLVARYDAALDGLTVWDATQTPHYVRRMLAELFDLPEDRIRVIAPPDVGGGFGPKASFYSEEVLIPWLARHLRQPVKWIEDRWENFVSAAQEREQVHTIEIGFTREGKLLALRDVFLHDQGAYANNGLQVPNISGTTVPGPYKIPNIHIEYRAVYTNMPPVTAVRGAGRPQGVFVMERMMDRMAERLGLDPTEVRFRNLVQAEDFPYPVGLVFRDGSPLTYDSGNYPELLRRTLARVDYAGLRAEQVALRAQGRHRGIGVAVYVEGVGLGPFEGALTRLDSRGKVIVTLAAPPQGQGYQTVFAQICADAMGLRMDDIEVVTGDTATIPFGVGTFASRVMANAGPSVFQAGAALKQKLLAVAAHVLEAAPGDLELAEGCARVRGFAGRTVPLAEIARIGNGAVPGVSMPEGVPAGLETSAYFTPKRGGYASGVHLCVVDVDAETGRVDIVRYVVGHDCGTVVNPLLVEGQVYGGVAHGLSNALYEEAIYDEQGQPLATSYLDYTLPSAQEVPRMDVFHLVTPSPLNPLGVKGAGEAGTIGAPAAISGAVEDALRPFGVKVTRLPLNPSRILALIQGG